MASSADPIDHDGVSTVATIGSKAVKYGAIAGIAALLLPVGIAVGAGALAIHLAAAGTVAGVLGGLAVATAGVIGTIGTWGLGGISALVAGTAGVIKGSDQVSKEQSAFRSKVTERMSGRENKQAKMFNDGEVKGLDEGYALAVKDLKPQMEAAYAQGQQDAARMIHDQMMQAMQAQQEAAHSEAPATNHAGKFTKVECKAEAIVHDRQEQAAAGHQVA